MLIQFFEGPIPGKFATFEKFWFSGEEEVRTGWRNVDRGPQNAYPILYSKIWINLM